MNLGIIFQDDELLTPRELKRRIHVTEKVWERSRLKVLAHLQQSTYVEVLGKGSQTMYHILHQVSDYETYSGRCHKRSKEENKKVYDKEILESVKKNPICTYKSITMDIKDKPNVKALEHKFTTSYEYVREDTKELVGSKKQPSGKYGKYEGKKWATQDEHGQWEEIPEVHAKMLNKILKEEFKEAYIEVADTVNEQKNDETTPQEARKQLAESMMEKYENAIDKFIDIYGYTPQKVPYYALAAWSEETYRE